MPVFVASLVALVASGAFSWALGRTRSGRWIGQWGGAAGCALGLIPAITALLGRVRDPLRLPWEVPGGSFHIALDALSALFLTPILALGALCALYGGAYMAHGGATPGRGHWFFHNLLLAAMAVVVVARNGVLFIVAWEVMALASFFLVTTDHERESVRNAGWTYLVATHLGTAFLLGFFALLGREAGSLDFDQFETLRGLAPGVAGTAFVLAVIGFGSKAGIVPFHVWLPEAHPAAPSHVSALMSGVMIKTGIYGLVRALTFLGAPPPWWGLALMAVGLTCGIYGVLFALAQHDLKRLLAFCSVENIGIIVLGIGVGLLGLSMDAPVVAALGFAGALLHVVNHAVFKGLLFLCTGSVLHATGTGEMDQLGGLLKRMPRTGLAFLVGAAAIVGLPPLNGFVSEYLIFSASFRGNVQSIAGLAAPLAASIAGLALISGLAAACFAKAFGIVFLGAPRSDHALQAHDPHVTMRVAQGTLAVACISIGFLAPLALRALLPAVTLATASGGLTNASVAEALDAAAPGLRGVTVAFFGLFAVCAVLALARHALLRGRRVEAGPTWGCGYSGPTARMQYTGSSFAQPLADLFRGVLQTRRRDTRTGYQLGAPDSFSTTTQDVCRDRLYAPLFQGIGRVLGSLRRLQHGNLHLYVLYIALTLLVLLIWKLR